RHVPAMLNKRGLSNIAKALIGEGLVIYENKLYPTADLMHRFKIQPIDIAGREGFALTSGTAITNSINSINLIHLMKLVSLLNLLEELNKLVHEDQTINITAELPSEKFNTFIKKAQNIQNSVNKEVNDEVLINHLSRTIENNTRKKTPATSILEELAIYADKACKIAAKFSNTTQTEAKPDEYLSIAVMKKLETGLSRVTESIRGVSNKISTQDIEKLSDNNREILQKYFKK
ncbi:MAG: aromatic amino acid lyase, partial [Bacteroidota bacterium]|nr:aromatic amino acid lyase [Bacteroidota bacterium]